MPLDQDLGRVEGSYYAPPLSLKSGRTRFRVSSFRKPLVFPAVAHVDVLVAASMNCHEILVIPVAMISV